LDVNDTTGQGLFYVLENELKLLGLDIDDVRGQGYDNGSNMKGKHQGVQKKLLDVNPRAFYSACGCHSLNLTLCDMARTCGKAKDFFGIIQRIYTTFANSTKKWQILKDNISGLTLKSISATRWESRVESVKAIRFQCTYIREAQLQVPNIVVLIFDNDVLILVISNYNRYFLPFNFRYLMLIMIQKQAVRLRAWQIMNLESMNS
jgi:hypothetical protein